MLSRQSNDEWPHEVVDSMPYAYFLGRLTRRVRSAAAAGDEPVSSMPARRLQLDDIGRQVGDKATPHMVPPRDAQDVSTMTPFYISLRSGGMARIAIR